MSIYGIKQRPDRWTQEELERTDDIDFAISVLEDRAAGLRRMSPLAQKIRETVGYLAHVKREKEKYLRRIITTGEAQEMIDEQNRKMEEARRELAEERARAEQAGKEPEEAAQEEDGSTGTISWEEAERISQEMDTEKEEEGEDEADDAD